MAAIKQKCRALKMLKNLWYKNSINFCPYTQWVGWRWGLFSGGALSSCSVVSGWQNYNKLFYDIFALISMGISSSIPK